MSGLRSTREKYLREKHGATDTEMAYINSVLQLKHGLTREETTSYRQPSDILDSWLHQGNWEQANDSVLLNRLSITYIVNATDRTLFDPSRQVLQIASKDGVNADLSQSFDTTNSFLDKCHEENCRAFVHCNRGVSRSSTIVLAYLMYCKKWSLSQAYEYLLTKRPHASPNAVLLLQLVRYENDLLKSNVDH
jgi:protein-tyrosine phosphatase